MVKTAHKMARSGYGMNAIAAKLNALGHLPASGKSKFWTASSIGHLLHTRTALGELVCKDGTTIKGYYPAILTEAEYYSTQKAVSDRFLQRGRRGKNCSNLFQGLIYIDGQKAWVQNIHKKYRYIIPSGAMSGAAQYVAYPYDTFERGILHQVTEIKAADLSPRQDDDAVTQLEGELAKIEVRIAEAEKEIETAPDFKAMARVLKGLEDKQHVVSSALEKARQARSTPETAAIKEAKSLAWSLKRVPETEQEEIRSSLRQRLRALIERIDVVIVVRARHSKTAECDITYRSGTKRHVTIEHGDTGSVSTSDDRTRIDLSDAFLTLVNKSVTKPQQ
jgi:hypothetical protein